MLPAHFNPTGRPLVWAHRGASAEAPENTVAAFSLALAQGADGIDRKSTRLNSSHANISYAVFCLKKKRRKGAMHGLLRSRFLLLRCAYRTRRSLALPLRS